MRIKALTRFNLSNMKFALIVFYSCFLGGTLIGTFSRIALSVQNNAPVNEGGSTTTIGFVVFMFITGLIGAQKETKFLITRSISRKEIYISSGLTFLILSAFLAAVHIITVLIDSGISYLFGATSYFKGISLDYQTLLSPDMSNIFVFYLTSFAFLLFGGTLGYLIGTFVTCWKAPTIGFFIVAGLGLIALTIFPGFFTDFLKVLKFLFTDKAHGLFIALKFFTISVILMALTFPIMRRITAVRQ